MQRQVIILLLSVVCSFTACSKDQLSETGNKMLPKEIDIPEAMREMLNSIVGVETADDYFPSESKIADTDVQSPQEAFNQLVQLYPDRAKKIECWTKFNNHYVFSLRYEDKIRHAYLHILYVRIGGRKFSYFSPHT